MSIVASLQAVLIEAARDVPGLATRPAGGRQEFLVGSQVVATVDGDVAEFRLDPAVAAAALRTPGTRRSTGSPERIAFAPEAVDRYAVDRAVAWLASAARRATAA